MATYLLTWNPTRWQWENIHECIQEIKEHGYHEGTWSCGVTKKIRRGDRVFLMRLGEEPRGILASGWVESEEVFEDEHWDKGARAKGKTALYIKVRFDTILDPEKRIFTRDRLEGGIYAKMRWETQASGVVIREDVADQLEKDWAAFLNRPYIKRPVFPEEAEVDKTRIEGAKKKITVNAYERDQRAREICINKHGFNCSVCGFSFEEMYGEIGRGIIHVHHLKPLAEIGKSYQLNPISDLRPVCPNCHTMIHQRKRPYGIDELRTILKRRKKGT